MCLMCHHKIPIIKGKEEIEKWLLNLSLIEFFKKESGKDVSEEELNKLGLKGRYLHTYKNETIELNYRQIEEIINNALCIIGTGVDMRVDIYSIQWKNDYVPKNF